MPILDLISVYIVIIHDVGNPGRYKADRYTMWRELE